MAFLKRIFGKELPVQDERIAAMQGKIYREMHFYILVICIVSVALKLIIHQGDAVLETEIVILLFQSFYYLFRASELGILAAEAELIERNSKLSSGKINFIFGLTAGIILALIFGLNSAFNYADSAMQSVYYFLLVFFVSLIIYVPLFLGIFFFTYEAAKRKSRQIAAKELEDAEDPTEL